MRDYCPRRPKAYYKNGEPCWCLTCLHFIEFKSTNEYRDYEKGRCARTGTQVPPLFQCRYWEKKQETSEKQ